MRREGNTVAICLIEPLVERLAVPAFFVGLDHRVVSANAACKSLLDKPDDAGLIGADLRPLLCPDKADGFFNQLDLIYSGRGALDVAMATLLSADGSHDFSVSPLRDAGRNLLGALCQYANTDAARDDVWQRQPLPEEAAQRRWYFSAHDGQVFTSETDISTLPHHDETVLNDYVQQIDPGDKTKVQNAFAALITDTAETFRLPYRVKMRDGTSATLLGEGVVTRRCSNGFPLEISVTETDLTGIAESQPRASARVDSELRWKTAVLSANQGVWDHDFENDRHFLSKTWRALRGLSEDAAVPETTEDWLKTIHPKDIDHIKEELRRLDAGDTDVINYKFRQRHSEGHWIWFLSRGRIVRRDAQGKPAHIIGTDIDITDIKIVEIESQRMAERLDVAMEAAGMARWEFNVNSNQAFWDDRMLKMFGIKDGRNLRASSDWGNFIHPEDRDAITAYTEDCLRNELDVACDYQLLTADGDVRHVRTRGKFVNDAETGPRYYGVNFDITEDKIRAQELEDARARLEYESRHDALTGLANRRRLDDVYTEHLNSADLDKTRIAVLHFDIDHFKQINDTLGHDAGDATLKHAADILRKNAPEHALVSRVGGDEFVALLFDAPTDAELEDIAEQIIDDMSRPYLYGAQECNIGTSIGIAVAKGCGHPDCNLFIDADLALYEAKKAGRGRFRFYSTNMKEEARRRKNSFDALLAGFDQGEITCHYQPQFDATTLELTGLEALVRWESARFGLIMPGEFLQTAEDMGLLAQFDELVLRRALYDLEEWQRAGLNVPPVSVNVSAHRLNDPSLGDRLRELELPRGMLSFELLESAFLDARNDVIDKNLKMISQMGIDIEIDDFGSGHASIASLLEIAPQRLKIDRTLIQPIVNSKRQRDLVRTIIGIGRMLDVRVVAEGVETVAHVPILQDMGCCYLQGFGLAHPMDAQAVSQFLADLDNTQGRLRLA